MAKNTPGLSPAFSHNLIDNISAYKNNPESFSNKLFVGIMFVLIPVLFVIAGIFTHVPLPDSAMDYVSFLGFVVALIALYVFRNLVGDKVLTPLFDGSLKLVDNLKAKLCKGNKA